MASTCVKFTYGGDPSNSDRDAVRFLVGDTIRARALLDDKEVDYAILRKVNLHMAASCLAEHLEARFSREADITVGSVSKSLSKIAEAFGKLAKRLKSDACSSARPSFPATTIAGKQALEQDGTTENPSFAIGQFDNPWATQFDELRRDGWDGF